MKSKKDKKAQFYIIASLIIIAVISGLATVVNYAAIKPEPIKFYDLGEDFQREAVKIIDQGVITEGDIETNLEQFTEDFLRYAAEKDPNVELIYIYGNKTNVIVKNYAKTEAGIETATGENATGMPGGKIIESKVTFHIGEEEFTRDITERMEHFGKVKESLQTPGDWIQLNLAGVIYDFNLGEEENFYIVFRTETEEDEVEVTVTPEPELPPTCVWVCTGWTPTTCPVNETQTRTCTNPDNCDTSKPAETQSCTYVPIECTPDEERTVWYNDDGTTDNCKKIEKCNAAGDAWTLITDWDVVASETGALCGDGLDNDCNGDIDGEDSGC